MIWVQHNSDESSSGAARSGSTSPELERADVGAAGPQALRRRLRGHATSRTQLAARGVGRLVVAGAQTDACVRSTLHGAFTRGYDAILVGDAHTTEDLSEWGAPPPDKVIAHTNLYWSVPVRTGPDGRRRRDGQRQVRRIRGGAGHLADRPTWLCRSAPGAVELTTMPASHSSTQPRRRSCRVASPPSTRRSPSAQLPIVGTLPVDLTGTYVRNGPNPVFTPLGSYTYPLEGDGMLHGVWLEGGRARYANRTVRTQSLRAEERAGRALFGGIMTPAFVDPGAARRRPRPGLAVQARRVRQRRAPRRALPRPRGGHAAVRGRRRPGDARPLRLRRGASRRHVRPPEDRPGDRRDDRVPLRRRRTVPHVGHHRRRRHCHRSRRSRSTASTTAS